MKSSFLCLSLQIILLIAKGLSETQVNPTVGPSTLSGDSLEGTEGTNSTDYADLGEHENSEVVPTLPTVSSVVSTTVPEDDYEYSESDTTASPTDLDLGVSSTVPEDDYESSVSAAALPSSPDQPTDYDDDRHHDYDHRPSYGSSFDSNTPSRHSDFSRTESETQTPRYDNIPSVTRIGGNLRFGTSLFPSRFLTDQNRDTAYKLVVEFAELKKHIGNRYRAYEKNTEKIEQKLREIFNVTLNELKDANSEITELIEEESRVRKEKLQVIEKKAADWAKEVQQAINKVEELHKAIGDTVNSNFEGQKQKLEVARSEIKTMIMKIEEHFVKLHSLIKELEVVEDGSKGTTILS